MGLLFLDLKYYEKSKEYFEKSYKIKVSFVNDYFLSNYVLDEQVLGYMANIYLELNDPEKAKNIYKRLITKYELLGKAKLLGSKVRQLTNLLYSNNETSEAEAVLLKFQNSNFLDSADFCVQYYSAYAFLLFNSDSLDKAIEYEKLSLKWRKQNGFHKMIMNSNVSIARYFVAKGILDSATYYFDQADKYFSTRTVINSSIYYYNVRAYYYQAIGDTLNYKKTLQIKNSIAYQKELTNKFFKAAQTIISKDNKLNKTKSVLKLFIAIAIAFFVLLIIIIYLL
jgi:tetratricopeptide (TPR) repeat protein